MRNVLDTSLKNLKWIKIRKKRKSNMLLLLSFVVTLSVFWVLRQPGLTLAGDASCGIVEHTHDDTCGTEKLVCNLSEGEPHIHDENCYETVWIVEREEVQLVCEELDEAHIHADDCYETIVTQYTETDVVSEEEGAYAEETLICEFPEEVHMHEDDCYEWDLICELEEHVHSMECYSDATADVETVLDWEEMFEDYPYTGDLREDLVGIAKTQVGYSESTLNFEVDDDGIRHGYTRYGAWYGTPYGDWSAMFVSFCLNYAGADQDEVPGNTGANSMIKRWDRLGKYAPADEYTPVNGDLVFFEDKTVGIIVETNDTTIYVIRGDVDDEVCTDIFALTDDDIIGWGSTVGTVPEVEDSFDIGLLDREKLLDISDGPAVYIFADSKVEPQMQNYSFRNTRSVKDMLAYLEANGGDYSFKLLDMDDNELPKDDKENYIVAANTAYKLKITYKSLYFLPGTYEYQVPNGLMVDGGAGDLILEGGINVGSWVITDDGLITMEINEEIEDKTNVTISASIGIHFPEQEEPIDFDGKITVTVGKPEQEIFPTQLSKSGGQGVPGTDKPDTSKIYWTVRISGNRDSDIPGSVLTDEVLDESWTHEHYYADTDIEAGLTFGASEPDPETGEELNWHSWTVSSDDLLRWDGDGWAYKMPETVRCDLCKNEITLGNDHWIYYVNYTSTPKPSNTPGNLQYINRVEIDNQTGQGWAEFAHSEMHAGIIKDGRFISDANGGKFLWNVQVAIPGREEGEKAHTNWLINDMMRIEDSEENRMAYVTNDMDKAIVTVIYEGETIVVPRIQDATEKDPFAWMLTWSNAEGGNGIYSQRQIYILCRCDCTAESCGISGGCWTHWFEHDNGVWEESDYCPCWTETEDTIFTFTYQTDGIDIIGDYGGLGYKVQNEAQLAYGDSITVVDGNIARVPIPSLVKKELTKEFDGYIANYQVTVNEGKLMLTDGSPLTIHDTMTDTLAYISGSLVITAEDEDGDITTLKQGVDYTVAYDGTGDRTDSDGNKVHVMDVVILHPQPVMYTLDYDATLIMPNHMTGDIKYSNSATISLWGKEFSDDTVKTFDTEFIVSAKSYKVEVVKTSAATDEPLGGAVFGLYNKDGGLITSEETDSEGKLYFQTRVTEGIILLEHIPYYIQELKAPFGYRLDDTKQWFCFCDNAEDYCATCSEILPDSNAVRIPVGKIDSFSVTNEYLSYDLPTTGGFGIYPLMLVSGAFVAIPLVYGCKQKRSRERKRTRRYSARRYRK